MERGKTRGDKTQRDEEQEACWWYNMSCKWMMFQFLTAWHEQWQSWGLSLHRGHWYILHSVRSGTQGRERKSQRERWMEVYWVWFQLACSTILLCLSLGFHTWTCEECLCVCVHASEWVKHACYFVCAQFESCFMKWCFTKYWASIYFVRLKGNTH